MDGCTGRRRKRTRNPRWSGGHRDIQMNTANGAWASIFFLVLFYHTFFIFIFLSHLPSYLQNPIFNLQPVHPLPSYFTIPIPFGQTNKKILMATLQHDQQSTSLPLQVEMNEWEQPCLRQLVDAKLKLGWTSRCRVMI